jgi:hypothetical protein
MGKVENKSSKVENKSSKVENTAWKVENKRLTLNDSTICNKILCTLIVLDNMSARFFNMLNMIVTKL